MASKMSKINSGTILIAFLAVLSGLAGVYLLRQSMKQPPIAVVQQEEPSAPALPSRQTVPMTSRSLPAGHKISLDDVAIVKLTRDQIKDYGLRSAFMTNPKQIIGKTISKPLERGKTFDTANFYPEGTGPGIANRIKPGRRGVTVLLTPTNALMGFAGSGQSVDVLFHYGQNDSDEANRFDPTQRNPTSNQDPNDLRQRSRDRIERRYRNATVTLVENAEILALGDKTVPTEDANGLPEVSRVPVTLLVTPEDAKLIRVADGHGELSLTLRGPAEQVVTKLAKATQKTNLKATRLDSIIPLEPRVRAMQIYRGQKSTVMQFDQEDSLSHRVVDSPNANRVEQNTTYDSRLPTPWASQHSRDPKPNPTSFGRVNSPDEVSNLLQVPPASAFNQISEEDSIKDSIGKPSEPRVIVEPSPFQGVELSMPPIGESPWEELP